MKIRSSKTETSRHHNSIQFQLESLEDRRLLAAFGPGEVARLDDGTGFATIQEALDAAAAAPGANTVEVARGTHSEHLVIDDTDHVRLVGAGSSGSVRIVGNGEARPIIDVILSNDVELMNFLVRDSEMDGIRVTGGQSFPGSSMDLTLGSVQSVENVGDGLHVDGADSVSIFHGGFNQNQGDGVELNQVGDVILEDVNANANDPGLAISGASSLHVTDSAFNNNSDHGIQLQDIAGDVTIDKTQAYNNDADNNGVGDGLNVTDGSDLDNVSVGGSLTVTDSKLNDTDRDGTLRNQIYGIYAEKVQGDVNLTNVRADGNLLDGVSIASAMSDVGVYESRFEHNGANGLEIEETGYLGGGFVTVVGARASHNGANGIGLSQIGADARVYETRSDDNGGNGLQFYHVSGTGYVADVVSLVNGASGVDVENFDTFTVTGATILKNGNHGIRTEHGGHVFVGDTQGFGEVRASENVATGFLANDVADVTVQKAKFLRNSMGGMNVRDAADIGIIDTFANQNKAAAGIQLESVDNVAMEGQSRTMRVHRNDKSGVRISDAAQVEFFKHPPGRK